MPVESLFVFLLIIFGLKYIVANNPNTNMTNKNNTITLRVVFIILIIYDGKIMTFNRNFFLYIINAKI